MATINVLGRPIDVDIREEIEEFVWENAKWTEDKLIATSPFRDGDSSPSFWVALTGEYAGVFGDSAYDDEYYRAGTLPKLLAFLRDESFEEACQYLLHKYDYDYSTEAILLTLPTLKETKRKIVLPSETYDKPIDYEYLSSRGIHPKVIEMNSVFKEGQAIGIVWRDINGDVCAIKYRDTRSKYFWYEKDATPLAQLVYGLDTVIKRGITRAVICEAEIDAMTWQSIGIYAIAIGGARINDKQVDMIVQSGLTDIILGGDNDEQGRKFNEKVKGKLRDRVTMWYLNYNDFGGCKDVNELGTAKLRNVEIRKLTKEVRI